MLLRRPRRRGAALVEAALVYPILFLLVFGILIMSLVVFRKQQVNYLAAEGARYACVRGAKYAEETRKAAATADAVLNNVVVPQAAGMNPSALTVTAAWNASNLQAQPVTVNDPVRYPSGSHSGVEFRANSVSVTVTYTWNTGMFGTYKLASTCTHPIEY
ncbi:TadE/TadG family type IV pilus assembly protein [Gemmata sp.]|uniref:TadE/TadG family type IV pilus assembly protein n=1 Tax=Gemmata sp. TaxID=1914242 RepID=UPI003F6E7665